MGLSNLVPWWSKIAIKLALSRTPVPYGVWAKLGIFRHGDMADPGRAIDVFTTHLDLARRFRDLPDGFTMLELGPGDSVLSAGVARAKGAALSILVDAGDFADRDPELFHRLGSEMAQRGLDAPDLPVDGDFNGILETLNATYMTEGVRSLTQIPDRSVDLIWSSVVLEHVHLNEFDAMAREFSRILRPDGVMSHAVDLRDHLGGSLNNLRFSHERWESPSWRTAGFYTNRLSEKEILDSFTGAGFQIVHHESRGWPEPPLAREKMHPAFQERSDAELSIAEFDVVMVKPDA